MLQTSLFFRSLKMIFHTGFIPNTCESETLKLTYMTDCNAVKENAQLQLSFIGSFRLNNFVKDSAPLYQFSKGVDYDSKPIVHRFMQDYNQQPRNFATL